LTTPIFLVQIINWCEQPFGLLSPASTFWLVCVLVYSHGLCFRMMSRMCLCCLGTKMSEFSRQKFNECWRSTEVIREYQRMLFTFGAMELPYVLVAEHDRFNDRTIVMKGLVPYSQISNKPIAEEQIEYGSVQSVLDKFIKEMESREDTETGLIKGALDGADISLMRYSMGLAIKSAPGNVNEFFEHMRMRRGEPIRHDEKVTDEDIRRLFG